MRGERIGEARVDFLPRRAGGILDRGLDLLRGRFALYVGMATLVWFPARALQPFLGQHLWMDRANAGDLDSIPGLFMGLFATAGATQLVQTLSAALVSVLARGDLLGEPVSARAALGQAARRMPGLIVIVIVTLMMSMVGCACCFLPLFVVMWMMSLAPIIYVLEGTTIGVSIQRSIDLTLGNQSGFARRAQSFLRWAAVMIAVNVLVLPFTMTGALGDNANVRVDILDALSISSAAFDLGLVLVSSVFFGVATAAVSSVLVSFYFDCRARRDGYDLVRRLEELQAAQVAADASGSPGPAGSPGAPA